MKEMYTSKVLLNMKIKKMKIYMGTETPGNDNRFTSVKTLTPRCDRLADLQVGITRRQQWL